VLNLKASKTMALTDNLISYYSLDEASGNAIDAHGSNDLTDNNTVASTTGKVGNCRDFELGSNEYFEITDPDSLSLVDATTSWTIAFWVNLESKGTTQGLVMKCHGGAVVEYGVEYNTGTDRFRAAIGNGTTSAIEAADVLGSPSLATWYFIVAWYDAVADTINISVNDGAVDSGSFTDGGANITATNFGIGGYGGLPNFTADGLIDEVGVWIGRVLTSGERTELYNSGSGRDYAYISGGGGGIIPQASYYYQYLNG
jgi:hypothetical protein